jgi:hypothetical protein
MTLPFDTLNKHEESRRRQQCVMSKLNYICVGTTSQIRKHSAQKKMMAAHTQPVKAVGNVSLFFLLIAQELATI